MNSNQLPPRFLMEPMMVQPSKSVLLPRRFRLPKLVFPRRAPSEAVIVGGLGHQNDAPLLLLKAV